MSYYDCTLTVNAGLNQRYIGLAILINFGHTVENVINLSAIIICVNMAWIFNPIQCHLLYMELLTADILRKQLHRHLYADLYLDP